MGQREGLPYVYNTDEGTHFVPRAVTMFGHTLNPGYFANPPGLTYVLHFVFAAWFGGGAGVHQAYTHHPAEVYEVARVTVALLGTAAVWLLYLTAARLAGRWVGLLAAALLAVAFLPVFYAHLALNDAPTLAPLGLALFGAAGVLRRGRPLDYLLAGIGLGLACAFKYTAGIVLLPLFAAALVHARRPGQLRGAMLGVVVALVSAALFFVIANPFAIIDFSAFRHGLSQQSSLSDEVGGKLGAPHNGGISYYLWTLTWGLGWIPALAAVGGAVLLCLRDRRLALVLVPAPLAFLVFMGTEGRYFGRWLLPIFPIVCVLGAVFLLAVVDRAGRARPRLRPALLALAVLLALGQGIVYSVHSDRVLSRADTRALARTWLVAHVPVGTRMVIEPVVPDAWVRDIGHSFTQVPNGDRWIKWPALRSIIAPDGALSSGPGHVVTIEDYERTLSPALIGAYERAGYCWVLTGYTQAGPPPPTRSRCHSPSPTTARSRGPGASPTAPRPTHAARGRSPSTSTGPSTTTTSPTRNPARRSPCTGSRAGAAPRADGPGRRRTGRCGGRGYPPAGA